MSLLKFKYLPYYALFAVLFGLLCGFYWPVLTEGRTQIHGDGILHGLAVLDLHHRALHDGFSLLWTEKAYGGHPIFAEGQGAFAHPLNILIAWFFPPVDGHVVYHFVTMTLAAIGVFGLARILGASALAAGFAGIGFTFSGISILTNGNLTVSGALVWMPYTLWAMEAWLLKPGWRRAALLGLATALSILAGYPQIMHGTVLFMVITLLVLVVQRSLLQQILPTLGRRIMTGVFAVVLCAGLAAIQWLPLLELVSYSHRNEGVDFISGPVEIFYRGMLYTLPVSETPESYFPVIGSLLVCVIASLAVLVRVPPRVVGYALAAVIMLQLSFADQSALFRLVYGNSLIPGLEYFRIMFVYQYQVVMAIMIIAAFAIDGLAKGLGPGSRLWQRRVLVVLLIGLVVFWGWAIGSLHVAEVPKLHYISAVLAVAVLVALVWNRYSRYIPLCLCALMFFEISQLQLNSYYFGDKSIIAKPASIQHFEQQTSLADYKVHDPTMTTAYSFWNPKDPKNADGLRRVLLSMTSSTNLLWDTPSYDGAFALPLYRQRLILDRINAEGDADLGAVTGLRFIDFLSIKYITAEKSSGAPGFEVAFHDTAENVLIYENTAAKPRFQAYTNVQFADTPEHAQKLVEALTEPMLILEAISGVERPLASAVPNNSQIMSWQVHRATPVEYQFTINAIDPGWFFISDANYPAWHAYLDGDEVPVYSAQVMGKAVYIPAGEHRLSVVFESSTFRWGAGITALSLLLLALALWRGRYAGQALQRWPDQQADQ